MAAAADRPSLASLSSCITCTLCRGYLIDAVTLVKCLHSFCKSCILKRLEQDSTCPVCELRVSTMKLDLHLKRDEALQNVVYKAVPGLYQREMKRRRDFYASRSREDKTGLSPEERGEMDDSSGGRVIFSPDEAISLSLEYKKSRNPAPRGEERCDKEKRDSSFKEPPKRYLNCPAAVTVALLQKFLRMKYSIGAKNKIDIYYVDEVLWSKYTLMDVAYIYSWRRDAPLELSFRIRESISTKPLSTEVYEPPKTAEYLKDGVARADHDEGPSGGDVGESRASEGPEKVSADHVGSPVDESSTSRGTTTSCRQPVQSTAMGTECKTKADAVSPSAESRSPEKRTETRCGPEISREIEKTSNGGAEAPLVGTSGSCGTADSAAEDSGCARTSGNFFRRTVPRKSTGPTSELARTDEADIKTSTIVESNKEPSKRAGTLAPDIKMPGNREGKTVEVSSTGNGGGDLSEESGTPASRSEMPTAPSPKMNGVDEDIFKTWRSVSAGKHLPAVVVEKKPTGGTVPDDTKRAAEREPVKTCVSRAADKAEAKLNALRAAAAAVSAKARVSESIEAKEKETRTCDSSGILPTANKGNVEATKKEEDSSKVQRVASRDDVNVTSAARKSPDKTEKEAEVSRGSGASAVVTSTVTTKVLADVTRESKEGGRTPTPVPQSPKPSTDAVTSTTEPAKAPAEVPLPTYLTLSRSHPSLFHAAPRKRGRPKLATVNSLNEEVERAHMLAKQAAAIEKKPAIPVVTSLRIKPIPPPPDRTKPEDGRRKSKRRRTEQPSREASVADPVKATPSSPPEKITIRVTRDETCTLKVEKLQRVSDGLHDSGFCEDAVERSPPPCPKPAEKKTKPTPIPEFTKRAPEEVHRKEPLSHREKTKEKPSIVVKVSPPQPKTESRKESRKRKSVEEWVDEQNKWIHAEKQTGKTVASAENPVRTAENPADGHKSRRGRKKANPVKIEKPVQRIESQRASAFPGMVPMAATLTTVPCKVVAPERTDVKERTRQEVVESSPTSVKPATELVIPRYVPNPATSIPLTVAHARNKRLKEAVSPKTCQIPQPTYPSKPAVERDDSEKSKFFKEVLNLSMKQAPKRPEVPSAPRARTPSETTKVTEDKRNDAHGEAKTTSATSPLDRVDRDRGRPSKEQGRSRLMGKSLFSRTRTKVHRDPPSLAPEVSKGDEDTTGKKQAEIMPKLSDTGVFRLEFPGDTEPTESRNDGIVESLKNIAHIKKTMMESRQQSVTATKAVDGRKETAKADAITKGPEETVPQMPTPPPLKEKDQTPTSESPSCDKSDAVSCRTAESSTPVGKSPAVTRTAVPTSSHKETVHGQSALPEGALTEPVRRQTPPANTYGGTEKWRDTPDAGHGNPSQSPTVMSHSAEETPLIVSRKELALDRTPDVVRIKTEPGLEDNVEDEAAGPSQQETHASEHMYRTTVAEIDLFTALSIIETIKGRATVHDIVEDYVAHLGRFFRALEAADGQTRRLVEDAFRPRRPVLLRLVGLLKKLTQDLSSNRVSRVFALEVLVERFLSRYDEDDTSKTDRSRRVAPSAENLAEPALQTEETAAAKERRVAKVARSKLWKRRRLAQVLKVEEPLWLLPVIPTPRDVPRAAAAAWRPLSTAEGLRSDKGSMHCWTSSGTSTPALRPDAFLRPTSICIPVNSFFHLVNPTTNGQRPSVGLDVRLEEENASSSPAVPESSHFERTFLAALRELLGGGGSEGRRPFGKTLCLETGAGSSLVITAPGTSNKLVLSAEVGRRVLTGLLATLGWSDDLRCPDLRDWESLLHLPARQTRRCGRLRAVEARGDSGFRAEGAGLRGFGTRAIPGEPTTTTGAVPTSKRCKPTPSDAVPIPSKKKRLSLLDVGGRVTFRRRPADRKTAHFCTNRSQVRSGSSPQNHLGAAVKGPSRDPSKRPAPAEAVALPSVKKRRRKSLHIPVIKGEAPVGRPRPSAVPRVRPTVLRRVDPAEQKRRRRTEDVKDDDDTEQKPKPVTSR